MGIPSYFSYIIKNYPNIVSELRKRHQTTTNIENVGSETVFEHLYMDCNSIIYDAVNSIPTAEEIIMDEKYIINYENALIGTTIEKIRRYIIKISPTHTVFIAFDGVAPFAKMNQQKTRRYKSDFAACSNYIKQTHNKSWSTSNITPGTEFMNRLSMKVKDAFSNSAAEFRVKKVVVSGSNEPGEGEHKIFQYIRENPDTNGTSIVYGLDADLIMLAIFHMHSFKNCFIFREAPEFIKSSIEIKKANANSKTKNNTNTNTYSHEEEQYLLDIGLLCEYILREMNCDLRDKRRVYDYAFMCFLLGNDFLPHFPALNIRTHGIPVILDMYTKTVMNTYSHGKPNYFISEDGKEIQWKIVKLFIAEIAKCEHSFLLIEYSARKKTDNWVWKTNTEEERERVMNNLPIIYRTEESFICPSEPLWESRYYMTLFPEKKDEISYRNTISKCYLDGLEWVYRYYNGYCMDWKWRYPYHYPPLFSDLLRCFPETSILLAPSLKNNGPVSPYVQLAYVLPKSQLYLLPPHIRTLLLEKYPQFFPDSVEFKWAFCRYFWEAHVDFDSDSDSESFGNHMNTNDRDKDRDILEIWEKELV